jgi:hypothetical protein
MIERIQRDQFWCSKVQSMKTLRSKWPELALKLCPVNLATGGNLGLAAKFRQISRKVSGAKEFFQ